MKSGAVAQYAPSISTFSVNLTTRAMTLIDGPDMFNDVSGVNNTITASNPAIAKVASGVYVFLWSLSHVSPEARNHIVAITVSISDTGIIGGQITTTDLYTVNTGTQNNLRVSSDILEISTGLFTVMISSPSEDSNTRLITFSVSSDGSSILLTDSEILFATYIQYSWSVGLTTNNLVVATALGNATTLNIATCSVDNSGNITILDTSSFTVGTSPSGTAANVAKAYGNIWCLGHADSVADEAYLSTFNISDVGVIGSLLDTEAVLAGDISSSLNTQILTVMRGIVALVYRSAALGGNTRFATFSIASDGTIGSQIDTSSTLASPVVGLHVKNFMRVSDDFMAGGICYSPRSYMFVVSLVNTVDPSASGRIGSIRHVVRPQAKIYRNEIKFGGFENGSVTPLVYQEVNLDKAVMDKLEEQADIRNDPLINPPLPKWPEFTVTSKSTRPFNFNAKSIPTTNKINLPTDTADEVTNTILDDILNP
jgi:hypothetical protein